MLYGRAAEDHGIAELLGQARDGRSGALVIRGEAGIGKTALLEFAASTAPPAGKAQIAAAVNAGAVPAARLDDFTRSMRTSLWWQIAVFALALVLSARHLGVDG